jgi:hypothetical protein
VDRAREKASEACEDTEKVIVRSVQFDEVPFLQAKLAQREKDGYEQFPLTSAIVLVAEDGDGLRAGMVCMRIRSSPVNLVPMWQIEPLILFPEFVRTSLRQSQRKATYLLAKAAEGYIADRTRNTTGVHAFFVSIETKNKPMHRLARHIGWKPPKWKIYAKEA